MASGLASKAALIASTMLRELNSVTVKVVGLGQKLVDEFDLLVRHGGGLLSVRWCGLLTSSLAYLEAERKPSFQVIGYL